MRAPTFLIFISMFLQGLVAFSQSSTLDTTFQPFQPEVFHTLRFAHRGGFAHGPENTLETMIFNIREFGQTHFEVDVMLTADSQLVLFHDETIERILESEQAKAVRELTLAEIQAIPLRDKSLGIVFVPSLQQLVDTLGAVSKLVSNDLLVEVDFKPHGEDAAFAVAKLVVMARSQAERYGEAFYNHFFVSSYYPKVVKELDQREPKIRKAFAVHGSPVTKPLLAKMAILIAPGVVRRHHVDIFEPNHCWATPKIVERWKRRGVLVNVYTANSACHKQEIEKWNVAYTTNCPEGSCGTDPSEQMGKPTKWCKKCEE